MRFERPNEDTLVVYENSEPICVIRDPVLPAPPTMKVLTLMMIGTQYDCFPDGIESSLNLPPEAHLDSLGEIDETT